jgi:hypothetical protein
LGSNVLFITADWPCETAISSPKPFRKFKGELKVGATFADQAGSLLGKFFYNGGINEG